MKSVVHILAVTLLFVLNGQLIRAQVEVTTLRTMITLSNPSPKKTYRITDAGKQGDWHYDTEDKESEPNVGTIVSSANRAVSGRFKRIFDYQDGVNIDWFLPSSTSSGSINEALLLALSACERVNFGAKTYQMEPVTITPKQSANPKRVDFHFQNTTLQAKNGLNRIKVIQLEDIPELTLAGALTLDGNAANVKISNPLSQGGEAFLHIISPSNNPKSKLVMGSVTIRNMPMCGITIFTRNDEQDKGYDRITVKAFREINGFNHLNIRQDDFAIWGVNVRGAHRAVIIDSLYAQQDNEVWGDAPIEKPFYTFTFENQVDPTVHKRKDSLYIKNLYAKYPCAIVLYTQAPNHVRIDNYVMDGALRKPSVADAGAYPTMLQKKLSWVGSKHTWTSYKSPKSSFYVKKLLIKNTNSAFMSESSASDITGLWLNKAITGAVFDEVETDVRLKFYGDGFYFGFKDVPDGRHRVGTFISHIPAKRNYVQPLNADLTIEKLHLAKGTGVTFAMGNAKIGAITQESGTYAAFESRENKYKEASTLYNGFIVESCKASNILWKFNWIIDQQNVADTQGVATGERYEFKNFSGNNLLQTQTTVSASNGSSVYMTANRFDKEPALRTSIEKFLQFVEFNWSNVSMKLTDSSPNNLTQRYIPFQANKSGLLNAARKMTPTRGWKKEWQPSSFSKCVITP
ncbi:hypothetical protein [Runella sp.]|jgi:hypothetical protein|uniref:hypothetical protein n=1 Tax=Runella sp. TaxID=1960881 RepID=UPI002605FFFC|nr:hypothetical protein [Runella sp.]